MFIFDFGGNGSRGKYRCPPATQARGMVHTSFITFFSFEMEGITYTADVQGRKYYHTMIVTLTSDW